MPSAIPTDCAQYPDPPWLSCTEYARYFGNKLRDTYDNGPNYGDPNGNHVGIDLDGNIASVATAVEPSRFNNASIWNVWIDYNGASSLLETRWSQLTVRPENSQLSLNVDLPSVLNQNEAFVGFTSATGSGYGNHDIISWEFRGEFRPIGVPEPNALACLCILAFAIQFRTRRVGYGRKS
ncbi:MAG: hypothetical protein IT422_18615 [Pirellulaceae bacterium]|nr:hypothetical protein [Pirellulaceae bacterium]